MVRRHPDKQNFYQPSKLNRYTQDQYDKVMEQVKQHIKYSIISENTGVNKSTIKNWASKTINIFLHITIISIDKTEYKKIVLLTHTFKFCLI